MNLTETDELVIAITAMVIGFVVCFFGKKIWKVFLFLAGFAAVAAITYYILLSLEHHNSSISLSKLETVLIPLAAGLVGGCIVLGVVQIGFFLAGALVGTVLAFMIFSVAGNGFGDHAFAIRLAIWAFLALACGVIVVKQEDEIIIFISAIGGSYSMFAGADHWVKSGYVSAIQGVFDNETLPSGNTKLYVMLGATVATAVIGVAFQILLDRKTKKEGHWESEPLMGRKKVNSW